MTSIPNISSLPNDALHHVVSFLSSNDALRLSGLNSSFQHTLSLSTLHTPTPLITHNIWNEQSDTPRRSVWIPVLFPHRTHSVVLTCHWNDQSWGNRKGTLFVVAVPANDDPNEETLSSIQNGKIVYESPIAPHREESLCMSFSYSPSMAYYLWYRVGGGGGHNLTVNYLNMHTVIHDCFGQWIGRNYNALGDEGFLGSNNNSFSLRMLRTLSLVGQEENTPESTAHLATLFEGSNFPSTSNASLKALEELTNALIAMSHKKQNGHDAPPVVRRRVGQVRLHREPPAIGFNFNGNGEIMLEDDDHNVEVGMLFPGVVAIMAPQNRMDED